MSDEEVTPDNLQYEQGSFDAPIDNTNGEWLKALNLTQQQALPQLQQASMFEVVEGEVVPANAIVEANFSANPEPTIIGGEVFSRQFFDKIGVEPIQQKTFAIAGFPEWKSTQLSPSNGKIVYTLVDVETGQVLKIGKASMSLSRFRSYYNYSKNWSRSVEANLFTFEGDSSTAESIEKKVRDYFLENEQGPIRGDNLPWDNTNFRLRPFGSGVPGEPFQQKTLRGLGGYWNGEQIYTQDTNQPVQYPGRPDWPRK